MENTQVVEVELEERVQLYVDKIQSNSTKVSKMFTHILKNQVDYYENRVDWLANVVHSVSLIVFAVGLSLILLTTKSTVNTIVGVTALGLAVFTLNLMSRKNGTYEHEHGLLLELQCLGDLENLLMYFSFEDHFIDKEFYILQSEKEYDSSELKVEVLNQEIVSIIFKDSLLFIDNSVDLGTQAV